MLRLFILIFLYFFVVIIFMSLRTASAEVMACYLFADPIVVSVFILRELDIRNIFKYLVLVAFAFIAARFSLGTTLFYFLSYSLLFYTYQKLIKMLSQEKKLSLLFSILLSLLIYTIYANILGSFIDFKCDFVICLCDFLVNFITSFIALSFIRRRRGI